MLHAKIVQSIKQMIPLLILGVIFGSQFSLVKVAVGNFSPIHLSFFRLLFSSLTMIVFVAVFYQGSGIKNCFHQNGFHQWKNCLILALLGEVLAPLLIALASKDLASGVSGIIIATAPFFTLLISSIFFKGEEKTGMAFLPLLLGFSGVALLSIQNFVLIQGTTILPYLLICGAALALGSANIAGKKLSGMDPILATTMTLFSGTILFLPVFIINFPTTDEMAHWNLQGLFFIFLLGLGVNALGTVAFIKIAQNYGAVYVSYVGYIIPAVSYLIGLIFLDEPYSIIHLLALAVILAGVLSLQSGHKKS